MARFGVVGCGLMGSQFADAVRKPGFLHDVTLEAVCDVLPERAERLGAAVAVPAFTSLERMIDEARLDAVYIATPDALHRDPLLTCASRGVHAILEKPLATTVEDARAMVEAATAADIVAEVHFGNRWSAPFVAAHEAIEAGDIGDVLSFMSRLNNAIESPTRMLSWAGRTTSAWFLLSHVLDLAQWLSGKSADRVWANGSRRRLAPMGIDTPDYVHTMVRYSDGCDGLFEASWVLPDSLPALVDFKFEVIGTEGALYVDTHDQMVHLASGRRGYRHLRTLDYGRDSLQALIDRVVAGDRSRSTLLDGLGNTRTLVAIHRSLESGAVERV